MAGKLSEMIMNDDPGTNLVRLTHLTSFLDLSCDLFLFSHAYL